MFEFKELLSLVQESLLYFQQEDIPLSKKEENPLPEKEQKKEIPQERKILPPKVAPIEGPKIKKGEENTKWPLYAGEPPERGDLSGLFSNVFKVCPLFVPIRLLLGEENEAHRLFLERVSGAITRQFAPASVELEKNFKWDASFIIAPFSLLRKKFPNLMPHHFYNMGNLTIFVLEELDLYLNNRELKLILWNGIKSTLSQTLSQNTPPSS